MKVDDTRGREAQEERGEETNEEADEDQSDGSIRVGVGQVASLTNDLLQVKVEGAISVAVIVVILSLLSRSRGGLELGRESLSALPSVLVGDIVGEIFDSTGHIHVIGVGAVDPEVMEAKKHKQKSEFVHVIRMALDRSLRTA